MKKIGQISTECILLTYLIANLLDAILTIYGISLGLTESNPLMVPLIASPLTFFIVKMFGGFIVYYFLQKAPRWTQFFCAGFGIFTVLWNMFLILTI